MDEVDKTALLRALRERVGADLDALVRRQRDARAGAVHEESRAEHAKDTRATEQSYLARGLAERVAAMRIVAANLSRLEGRRFGAADPIAIEALVVVRDLEDDRIQTWWLVPGPPGIELPLHDRSLQTLTPAAPLGRALLGLRAGDEGSFASPAGERSFEILAVA